MFLQLNQLPVKRKNPGRVDLLATTTKCTFFWSPVRLRSTALTVLYVQLWSTCCVALLHFGRGQSCPFSSLLFVILKNFLRDTFDAGGPRSWKKTFLVGRRDTERRPSFS